MLETHLKKRQHLTPTLSTRTNKPSSTTYLPLNPKYNLSVMSSRLLTQNQELLIYVVSLWQILTLLNKIFTCKPCYPSSLKARHPSKSVATGTTFWSIIRRAVQSWRSSQSMKPTWPLNVSGPKSLKSLFFTPTKSKELPPKFTILSTSFSKRTLYASKCKLRTPLKNFNVFKTLWTRNI